MNDEIKERMAAMEKKMKVCPQCQQEFYRLLPVGVCAWCRDWFKVKETRLSASGGGSTQTLAERTWRDRRSWEERRQEERRGYED